jgi:predicted RNA methylase
MATKVTDEMRVVLEGCTIEGNLLRLPEGQLDRKMYVAVNKVLTDLGGKWTRKVRGHMFPGNPADALATVLETGKSENQKSILQAFFTPKDLAGFIVSLVGVKGDDVLEPSAGEGALALACMRAGAASVLCVEQHPPYAASLRALELTVREGDFLESPAIPAFSKVVMNPPFTKNQDVKHVRHALQFLTDGGKLVSIMAGNETRRSFVDLLEWLDDQAWNYDIHELPEGSFKQSGTNVSVLALVVRKG